MCAIAGVFSRDKNVSKKELEAAVSRMNAAQARRGPDDQGVFSEVNERRSAIVLGNCRLSIIDLTKAGHQPMQYITKDGREFWVTFNGEIYNFRDLKKSLEAKGYVFKTKTDTEALLALYAEYGESSFAMLRGMFAFALLDVRQEKLFLVKDRYGIKPLYYFMDGARVVFASEVRALMKSGLVPDKKEPKTLIGFLLLGSVPLPFTTVQNVLALPPGHYMVISGKESMQAPVRYYDPLDFFEHKQNISFTDAVHGVRERLEDAVERHLISDAPLGVFLSGGLDSSALAALAARELASESKRLLTLSVVFDEKEFSEERYSAMLAKQIGSDHRTIKITKQDFYDSFNEIFDAMDQPTIDGVNTFFVSLAAKKAGLKAVLSGLGGDEVFCGYPAFQRAELIRYIQRFPKFLKYPLTLFSSLGDRLGKLAHISENDMSHFYLIHRGLFSPAETARLLGANLDEVKNVIRDDIFGYLWSEEKRLSKLHPVDLLSYLEIQLYLQNQLLKDTDSMSMYHSLEVRVPFLDHPLVEYAAGLDTKIKMSRQINKPLLAEAVKDIVPQEILTRKKMGFTFPFAEWLMHGPIANREAQIVKKQFALSDTRLARLHWSRFWALAVLARLR